MNGKHFIACVWMIVQSVQTSPCGSSGSSGSCNYGKINSAEGTPEELFYFLECIGIMNVWMLNGQEKCFNGCEWAGKNKE